jgi:hypothetical protein
MSWLRRNYRMVALAAGSVAAALCPLLPAAASAPCSVAQSVLRALAGL